MVELGKALLRYGFCPLMLLGVNGAGLWLVASGASKWWLLALLGGAIGLSFAAERLLPYEEDWNRSHGDSSRDALHALVNEAANFGTLLLLPVFTALLAIGGVWPSGWPFVLQVLFAIIVADAGIALAHYASHRSDLLWRFHAVHHSVKRMYGFNGLMKHPVHQAMLLAVLESRCGLNFSSAEVYLNVAGGYRLSDPAADCAVAAALVSAIADKPLPMKSVWFGEISLAGEVRPVVSSDRTSPPGRPREKSRHLPQGRSPAALQADAFLLSFAAKCRPPGHKFNARLGQYKIPGGLHRSG